MAGSTRSLAESKPKSPACSWNAKSTTRLGQGGQGTVQKLRHWANENITAAEDHFLVFPCCFSASGAGRGKALENIKLVPESIKKKNLEFCRH